VGINDKVGMIEVVRMDSKGRILIPKAFRDRTELKEGSYVKVESEGKRLIIEPTESAAIKHYGRFKVDNIPDDLDAYVAEEIQKHWLKKTTST
jgi:AbrB family looped-hinge helix DNA binding protein